MDENVTKQTEDPKASPEVSSKKTSRSHSFAIKLSKKQKKIIILAGSITLGVIILIYLGFVIYFSSHFYFGTKMNNINCNGKTALQAEKLIKSRLENYSLAIKERNSQTEIILGSDISLVASLESDISKLKKEQNPFAWPVSLFHGQTLKVDVSLSYDEDQLANKITGLSCMQKDNMSPAINASLEYSAKDKAYVISSESLGTTLDTEKVSNEITSCVKEVNSSIDLNKTGCYIDPTITSESESIKKALSEVNTYLKANLTYKILGNTENINGDIIRPWINWNENFEVSLDSEAIAAKVKEWAFAYNTVGKTKTLNSSYGAPVTISSGDYGWKINVAETRDSIISCIQKGDTAALSVSYSQKAASEDPATEFGNTYVEINLGSQHLYFYKNGALVIESDFVSGKVVTGCATPTGIYSIKYKKSPAILRGADYASHVTYWMPFNQGIGLHDANWRSKFGGKIFYNSGSHGCINLPTNTAKTIYNNVEAGTPVIVYNLPIDNAPADPVELSPEEQLAAEHEQNLDEIPAVAQPNDVVNTPTPVTPVPVVTEPPVVIETPTPIPVTPVPENTVSPAPDSGSFGE